jgi:glyoxylase-like metal-dependent hydrolase (beta-lactamase superfamily II)
VPAWICCNCGVQSAETAAPPDKCPICEDEREAVRWDGQQWTTMDRLAANHAADIREEEPGLIGVGTSPSFAIGQRALVVRTPNGNVLWDCVSLLDEQAAAEIQRLGGLASICMSHPHFYGANVEFADRFDARILIPRADERWIQRRSRRIILFDDVAEPLPGLKLIRIGGHFDGAAVLHWPAGSDGRGALLTGDTIAVAQDREWVSFMWSFPNFIPLDETTITDIVQRIEPLAFDRIYGGWWGRVVITDGSTAVRRSAERYIARLHGERPETSDQQGPSA